MRFSVSVPTVLPSFTGSKYNGRSVPCNIDLNVEVKEFSSKDAQLAFQVPSYEPHIDATDYVQVNDHLFSKITDDKGGGPAHSLEDAQTAIQSTLLDIYQHSLTPVVHFYRQWNSIKLGDKLHSGVKSGLWSGGISWYKASLERLKKFQDFPSGILNDRDLERQRTELSEAANMFVAVDGALYRKRAAPVLVVGTHWMGSNLSFDHQHLGTRYLDDSVNFDPKIEKYKVGSMYPQHSFLPSDYEGALELTRRLFAAHSGERRELRIAKNIVSVFSDRRTDDELLDEDLVRFSKRAVLTALDAVKETDSRKRKEFKAQVALLLESIHEVEKGALEAGGLQQSYKVVVDFLEHQMGRASHNLRIDIARKVDERNVHFARRRQELDFTSREWV
jgi:hypothetical protein